MLISLATSTDRLWLTRTIRTAVHPYHSVIVIILSRSNLSSTSSPNIHSPPPSPNILAHPTMSGKKNPRSEVRFNFSVINKIRSIICVEKFRMIAQKSMTVPKQREACFKLYHGEKEIMGQAEKFIKHSSIYSDVWAVEQSKQGPRYYIPERLHQQYGNMLVGGDNITESLIRKLSP